MHSPQTEPSPTASSDTAPASLNRTLLQAELLATFRRYGLDVGVGLTKEGVMILSQTSLVDARNSGTITVL